MTFNKSQIAFLLFLVLAWWACVSLSSASKHPLPAGRPTPPPAGPDWINLLAGNEAAAWKNITDGLDIFEVRDGTLHVFGRTITPLRYVGYEGQRFADFDLHLEFKVTPKANSGVFLRVVERDPLRHGFEVQVLDDFGGAPSKNGSGAIYDVVSPMFNLARPAGEWNSYDISMENTKLTVAMNGWKVIDTDLAQMTTPLGKFKFPYAEMPREGLIALQDHGGEVWYRNIFVRPH